VRRYVLSAAALVAAFATSAAAWPPVCKPLVYDLTGVCV
jgi:hypothetical protein